MGHPKQNLCMCCMNGYYIDGRCKSCGSLKMHAQKIPVALPVGYQLRQRYIIGSVLGKGGFGITYIAWDTHTDRRIAIKELFPNGVVERSEDHHTVHIPLDKQTSFDELLSSFKKEVGTLIQLQNHKSILSLYHMFEENQTAYYVMEYLDGQDLSKLLKANGPMAWPQLMPIIKSMMDALEELHKVGLIHRDVSPDNIFITKDGEHRLIDLGSTRTYQGNSPMTAYVKLNFAPYEQFMPNGVQGPWTDVYSLCATCYYSLTGKTPVVAAHRIISDTMIPLSKLCPTLPKPVLNALESGLQINWEDRCQSISSLRKIMFPKEEVQHSGYTSRPGYTGHSGHTASPGYPNRPNQTGYPGITCINGMKKGYACQLSPGKPVRIGRAPECEIRYPPNTSGISRKQCTFLLQNDGRVLVRDDNSSYGTHLITKDKKQVKLTPMQWYYVDNGWIVFGNNEQYLTFM